MDTPIYNGIISAVEVFIVVLLSYHTRTCISSRSRIIFHNKLVPEDNYGWSYKKIPSAVYSTVPVRYQENIDTSIMHVIEGFRTTMISIQYHKTSILQFCKDMLSKNHFYIRQISTRTY